MTTLPGFFSTPGAAIPGMFWPGAPISALAPPIFVFPAMWSVQWAQAETLVTVAGLGATLAIAPAGPLAATVAVASAGQATGLLQPPGTAVFCPAPPAVIQPD